MTIEQWFSAGQRFIWSKPAEILNGGAPFTDGIIVTNPIPTPNTMTYDLLDSEIFPAFTTFPGNKGNIIKAILTLTKQRLLPIFYVLFLEPLRCLLNSTIPPFKMTT